MNPIVLYLASGESLYPGVILLISAMVLPTIRHKWLLRFRNLVAATAAAMILMACPPVPFVIFALFLLTWAAWFILANLQSPRLKSARLVAIFLLAVLSAAIAVSEWPYRAAPLLQGVPCDHLAVIGDSLSAGIETSQGNGPWPVAFQRLTSTLVSNYAQAGAQVSDGPSQARHLIPEDRLILIELGGNDLIANVPAADFERGLAATLVAIDQTASPDRIILMFELPLLPHKIEYGRIQRRLAAEHGILLIAKRFLTDVLGASGATSDGLHLAPAGADRMAALVAQITAPVLKVPPAATNLHNVQVSTCIDPVQ